MKYIHKLCRICATESDVLVSLFSALDEILEENVTTLADVFVRLTSATVSIGDGLPLNICSTCTALMHTAYVFVLKYERSFELLKIFANEIDQEDDSCESSFLIEHSYALGNEIKAEIGQPFIDAVAINEVKNKVKNPVKTEVVNKVKNSVKHKVKNPLKNEVANEIKNPVENKVVNKGKNPVVNKVNNPVKKKAKRNEESATYKILHQCPICTSEFKANDLRSHLQTHKSLKKYLSIPEDLKVSSSTKFYYEHKPDEEVVTIHRKTNILHKCLHCEIELPALELREHMRSLHGGYSCNQCNRVFRKINHLTIHKIKHMKEYPYHCEHCGKGFVIEKNYDYHMLTHNTKVFPYQCSHCSRGFYNPEHLHRHQFIHTENMSYTKKYPVYNCINCLKSFKNKEELQEHVCVPIKSKVKRSFKCTRCNLVLKNGSALYFHRRRMHDEVCEVVKSSKTPVVKKTIKTRRVLCDVCGKYYSNYSIYAHMSTHRHDRYVECSQCGKLLSGKQQLRHHMLIHTGEKPYVCHVCGKSFNKMYNLQVHERIHKGDRRHVCTVCNKGFLEKSYLRKHMNVHRNSQL